MVRAILDGRKTQTRRVLKPQPRHRAIRSSEDDQWYDADCVNAGVLLRCPYGQPGERLWARETWAHVPVTAYRCSEGVQQTANPNDPDMAAVYAAGWDHSRPGRWRPSIYMPRWASRLTLEITAVRAERLQDISEVDAAAEGVEVEDYGEEMPDGTGSHDYTCIPNYRRLWESINGLGSWAKNPWVWVMEFRRIAQ